jgi:hypothetical protein
MTTHEKIEVARVRLTKPFSDFFVQIEPTDRDFEGKQYHDLILKAENMSHSYHFCSIPSNDIEQLINDARSYGPNVVKTLLEHNEAIQEYYDHRYECCECCNECD